MTLEKTEGIILHTLNFKDYDQILTVFSPDHGIQKFVLNGGQSFKRKKGAASSPFTQGEFVYRKKENELLTCKEISVISYHHGVRRDLQRLETACEMIQLIQKTQQPGKPAPLLYNLFIHYLKHLPQTTYPNTLLSSFFLKLLRHDGLLGSFEQCSTCHANLTNLYYTEGESFCSAHKPPDALHFPEDEKSLLKRLLHSRSLAEISNLEQSDIFREKIKTLQKYLKK